MTGETALDAVTPRLVAAFRATFGDHLFDTGDAAPLGLHWCLAPPLATTDSLGPDGHPPRRQGVSAADFPRRMWVGGALELLAPLPVGAAIERRTHDLPAVRKSGGSGDWWLAGAAHEFHAGGGLLLAERQDIAFRPAATTLAASALPGPPFAADLDWALDTPPTLLFRYSALTFNSHRIHYDAPYAMDVEAYPGLVVHGPLQATLLLNLAAVLLGRTPQRMDFRATAPLIGGRGLIASGRRDGDGVTLQLADGDGVVTMAASASGGAPIPGQH